MIKIMISYFYMIRFFKPNYIPLSTALWDPKWFHENKEPNHNWIDNNGVVCGLRIKEFQPLKESICPCKSSKVIRELREGKLCDFLSKYETKLKSYNFNDLIKKLEIIGRMCKEQMGFKENPVIVLIVYEEPNRICSERTVIKKFFNENGIEIEEFSK